MCAQVKPAAPPHASLPAWRSEAGQRLPELMAAVFEDYQVFAAAGAPQDSARDFAAHHAGCRTAIAHLEALLRLARTLTPETPAKPAADHESPQLDRRRLLREARRALGRAAADHASGEGA